MQCYSGFNAREDSVSIRGRLINRLYGEIVKRLVNDEPCALLPALGPPQVQCKGHIRDLERLRGASPVGKRGRRRREAGHAGFVGLLEINGSPSRPQASSLSATKRAINLRRVGSARCPAGLRRLV